MSVDLLQAYRRRQGWSQRTLARALGVSDAFVSYVLDPEPPLLQDKRLSPARERQLVGLLDLDADCREVLQYHLAGARRRRRHESASCSTWLSTEQVDELNTLLRKLHGEATFAGSAVAAKRAYVQIWDLASQVVDRIHPRNQQLARVDTLMILHDAACVLDRADLALGYARQALDVLERDPVDARNQDRLESSKVHASRAEIVALNNLELPLAASKVAQRVEAILPGFQADRAAWLPQLCSDRLSSLSRLEGVRRFPISEAENLRERAEREAQPSATMQVLLDNALARAFLAHGTARSLRKALPLVERGLQRAENPTEPLGPLHRAMLLRTAARYEWKIGGTTATWSRLLRACLELVDSAGLTHQRAELARQYGAEVLRQVARSAQPALLAEV
jgi:transcriptional regulator with XRE-family HTH domain